MTTQTTTEKAAAKERAAEQEMRELLLSETEILCVDETAFHTMSGLRLVMIGEMIVAGKHLPLADLKRGWVTAAT